MPTQHLHDAGEEIRTPVLILGQHILYPPSIHTPQPFGGLGSSSRAALLIKPAQVLEMEDCSCNTSTVSAASVKQPCTMKGFHVLIRGAGVGRRVLSGQGMLPTPIHISPLGQK